MIGYVKEEADCRSRMIGIYFGDNNIRTCGICDNCLKQKKLSLSKEEFTVIHERIRHIMQDNSLEVKELFNQLQDIKKEKAWKVIEFLQAENKLRIEKDGRIRLK